MSLVVLLGGVAVVALVLVVGQERPCREALELASCPAVVADLSWCDRRRQH